LAVPFRESPPAVPVRVAAKATPERATISSATVIIAIAVRLISLSFSLVPSSSLPAHTVPPRKAADHAQSTHTAHTPPFVWVPCGCGGGTADPEGNRLDRSASKKGLLPEAKA
jgi:hypothetical protein